MSTTSKGKKKAPKTDNRRGNHGLTDLQKLRFLKLYPSSYPISDKPEFSKLVKGQGETFGKINVSMETVRTCPIVFMSTCSSCCLSPTSLQGTKEERQLYIQFRTYYSTLRKKEKTHPSLVQEKVKAAKQYFLDFGEEDDNDSGTDTDNDESKLDKDKEDDDDDDNESKLDKDVNDFEESDEDDGNSEEYQDYHYNNMSTKSSKKSASGELPVGDLHLRIVLLRHLTNALLCCFEQYRSLLTSTLDT